jgi:hypothetical protein
VSLGPHTVTVTHRPAATTDSFGNPYYDWSTATTTDVTGCSVQPVPAREVIVGRETVVSRWQVWAPSTATVEATDRVVYSGDTYDIDGEVQAWDFPVLPHKTFLLRRSESS